MAVSTSKMQTLLALAKKGPLRPRDLDRARIPRAYLQRLCDRGELERVQRGLYRVPDAPITELHSFAEVTVRVPKATICLLSALQVHELTTEAPHAVWILIDKNARTPRLTTPALRIVRASGRARKHGVEARRVDGVDITITNPAKTVADCFRYRRHVGLDVAIAALRDYLGKPGGHAPRERGGRRHSIDALIEAARVDRVYNFMRPYLEALA